MLYLLCWQFLPINSPGHSQEQLATRSVQIPPFLQGSASHSFTSAGSTQDDARISRETVKAISTCLKELEKKKKKEKQKSFIVCPIIQYNLKICSRTSTVTSRGYQGQKSQFGLKKPNWSSSKGVQLQDMQQLLYQQMPVKDVSQFILIH